MDEKDWLSRPSITNSNSSYSSNDMNYSYQLPSRKAPPTQQQQQQQQYFPLTPPLSSSSSCSSTSSSSISDSAFQSPFIPRNLNTSNTVYNKDNFNNNCNNIYSPIVFNPTWDESNNQKKNNYSFDDNNMNNYYFNYSSILNTLEEDDEEEEHFYTHYQNNYT